MQKKERAPGNKRWNNAHNHKHDNVEDAIVSINEQILNLNFSDKYLRNRVQDRLYNASKILRLRGNEAEVNKEFNETLLQLQQEAENKMFQSDVSITGGKRTRRNRKHKNKKSRKYTRRN